MNRNADFQVYCYLSNSCNFARISNAIAKVGIPRIPSIPRLRRSVFGVRISPSSVSISVHPWLKLSCFGCGSPALSCIAGFQTCWPWFSTPAGSGAGPSSHRFSRLCGLIGAPALFVAAWPRCASSNCLYTTNGPGVELQLMNANRCSTAALRWPTIPKWADRRVVYSHLLYMQQIIALYEKDK